MSATAASLSQDDKSARLPRWVNNLLVIVLGVVLALLALSFLPADDEIATSPTVSGAAVSGTKAPDAMQLGQKTAGLHVFGDAGAKPKEVVVVDDEPPPPTNLNLQLAGVFAFEPRETAFAIISEGQGEQNAYGIGDKISGETRLVEVFPEYVVINNRGKDEILKMSEAISSGASQQPIQRSASQQPAQQNFNQPIELPTNPGELRDTLARNPSMLGRIVAAEPYQENGKLVGYRITPKQNPEILEAQGIVAGDIITRVNNIQLNSQKQGIRALRNAVKAENLEVMILRDGVEVPVSISLAQ